MENSSGISFDVIIGSLEELLLSSLFKDIKEVHFMIITRILFCHIFMRKVVNYGEKTDEIKLKEFRSTQSMTILFC